MRASRARPTPRIRGETVAYPRSPYRGRPPITTPAVVVDAVILEGGHVALIRRARPPWKGRWALPGGFVELGESLPAAVIREAAEETGLSTKVERLVGVYSDPGRDPRAHIVAVAYRLEPLHRALRGGDDAAEARWWPLGALPALAADHAEILRDALASEPRRPPTAHRTPAARVRRGRRRSTANVARRR